MNSFSTNVSGPSEQRTSTACSYGADAASAWSELAVLRLWSKEKPFWSPRDSAGNEHKERISTNDRADLICEAHQCAWSRGADRSVVCRYWWLEGRVQRGPWTQNNLRTICRRLCICLTVVVRDATRRAAQRSAAQRSAAQRSAACWLLNRYACFWSGAVRNRAVGDRDERKDGLHEETGGGQHRDTTDMRTKTSFKVKYSCSCSCSTPRRVLSMIRPHGEEERERERERKRERERERQSEIVVYVASKKRMSWLPLVELCECYCDVDSFQYPINLESIWFIWYITQSWQFRTIS